MKVRELIEYLKNENPEMEIMLPGYEGGIEKLHRIKKIKVLWTSYGDNTEDWEKWVEEHDTYFGPYDEDTTGREVILFDRLT